jgi:branched-chain amino acid transport system ATP-binding protein
MSALLQMKEISKSFGGIRAVTNVNLSVEPGKIVSIIGPNGAGKTTVFNCITGFYCPDQGELLFNGENITGQKPHSITVAGVARTFQNIRLFGEMSALENVMVGRFCRTHSGVCGSMLRFPKAIQEDRIAAQHSMDLLKFVGLENEAYSWARNIAYGKQRRLEIARALATNPKIILLDEPAAGMNPTETAEMIALIRKISREKATVLLIEHDMKLVMNISDRIMVLHHGEVLAEGTPSEVRSNPQVIEAYLGKATE